jgi:hypothetical protein
MVSLDSLDGWKVNGWRSRDESQTDGHALDDAGGMDQPASTHMIVKSVCRWFRMLCGNHNENPGATQGIVTSLLLLALLALRGGVLYGRTHEICV